MASASVAFAPACSARGRVGARIGPLLADSPALGDHLIRCLLSDDHPGVALIDSPGASLQASQLMERIGFQPLTTTQRMYRGEQPDIFLNEVFGLACLELG